MHNFSEIDLCKTGFIYIGVIFRWLEAKLSREVI
jgi:hypothetical protein